MSGRTVVGFEKWAVRRDWRAGAEPVTWAMQCAVCRGISPRSGQAAEVEQWAANHAARNRLHTDFRRITHTPFRASRAEDGDA